MHLLWYWEGTNARGAAVGVGGGVSQGAHIQYIYIIMIHDFIYLFPIATDYYSELHTILFLLSLISKICSLLVATSC
jgi:hypothetical protein